MADWKIYRGSREPHDGIQDLGPPPPWRDFSKAADARRGDTFEADPDEIAMVNVALALRRPLLVTGSPGFGKSSLAYAVARELKLGDVLVWPINTRSTLGEGLYHYDAIGRLQQASLLRARAGDERIAPPDIGEFLSLGPLGTALFPRRGAPPRVLLIDEVDKSDIDLPNDLLHVLEQGEFEIPELVRLRHEARVREPGAPETTRVRQHRSTETVDVEEGHIRCDQFPLIVMTSNGEREFPPAFMRRCLHLEMKRPPLERLTLIVARHLTPDFAKEAEPIIRDFLSRQSRDQLATDQLLSAIFMTLGRSEMTAAEREAIRTKLLVSLGPVEPA
jgi:MoxR-like ATPase